MPIAEERLTELVAEAVATLPDALVIVNRDGVIAYWSPGAERIFGLASDHAVGETLDLIIPERLRERHWSGFERTIASGQSRYGPSDLLAVPALRADGTTISIEFSIAIMPVGDGSGQGYVAALIRDVSERRAQEQEMRLRLRELEKPQPND